MHVERGRQPSHNATEEDINDGMASTKRSRDPSASDSDTRSNSERGPSYGSKTLLKRDSSYSSYSSYSSRPAPHEPIQDTEKPSSSGEERRQGEESDVSDYVSVGSRRIRLSREPSETPSISSMTGTLSISGSARALQRPHSRHSLSHDHELHRLQKRGDSRPHSSIARYSYPGEPRETPSNGTAGLPSGTYLTALASRAKSTTKSENRPASFPSSTADPLHNPFLTSTKHSPLPTTPLPPSFPDAYSGQLHRRSSTQFSPTENDKLNELQQELAAIKEQVSNGG